MKRPLLFFFLSSLLLSFACLDPTADGNLVPATVDDDPSLPRVALNGSVFHAETFGDPSYPVVIMLHGGPGQDYRSLLRLRQPVDGVRLEDRHLVVFWDQRSSGLSRRHDPADITVASYDADLEAFVDHYAPNRPVVFVAHSSGALHATRYIGQHPDRVAGAVLMDSGPLDLEFFDEVKSRLLVADYGAEWLNDTAWGQSIVTPDGHARLDYIRMLGFLGDAQPGFHESTTDRAPVWRFGALANRVLNREAAQNGWQFTAGIDRYTKPVLFEAGELDEVVGVDYQTRQAKLFPNAKVVKIAGVGHDHQWVAPEATMRPVLSYLAEIGF